MVFSFFLNKKFEKVLLDILVNGVHKVVFLNVLIVASMNIWYSLETGETGDAIKSKLVS